MIYQPTSHMFGQKACRQGRRGMVKTCKRCYFTGQVVYERVNVTESNLEPIAHAMYGVCFKCGSKVFIEFKL